MSQRRKSLPTSLASKPRPGQTRRWGTIPHGGQGNPTLQRPVWSCHPWSQSPRAELGTWVLAEIRHVGHQGTGAAPSARSPHLEDLHPQHPQGAFALCLIPPKNGGCRSPAREATLPMTWGWGASAFTPHGPPTPAARALPSPASAAPGQEASTAASGHTRNGIRSRDPQTGSVWRAGPVCHSHLGQGLAPGLGTERPLVSTC